MTVDIYDRQSSLPSSSVHAAVSTALLLAFLPARLMRGEQRHEKPGHFSSVKECVSRMYRCFFEPDRDNLDSSAAAASLNSHRFRLCLA